jgi:hypothetical protein
MERINMLAQGSITFERHIVTFKLDDATPEYKDSVHYKVNITNSVTKESVDTCYDAEELAAALSLAMGVKKSRSLKDRIGRVDAKRFVKTLNDLAIPVQDTVFGIPRNCIFIPL